MYNDNELDTCPICGTLGTTAPDLWGKIQFFHKIPSPRLNGYFSFTDSHVGVMA